ncbi:hypothetical protein PVAP13_4KG306410 [Panicum virgatum]|uniref:Uncharacterized protein n=1 Tax=Panicum virgatum TaxID=38727 RepID=A0A8T0TUY6_PANVG|nr:hypothetical protein PVAP13_4KG306410 [Panicum virgatum]
MAFPRAVLNPPSPVGLRCTPAPTHPAPPSPFPAPHHPPLATTLSSSRRARRRTFLPTGFITTGAAPSLLCCGGAEGGFGELSRHPRWPPAISSRGGLCSFAILDCPWDFSGAIGGGNPSRC